MLTSFCRHKLATFRLSCVLLLALASLVFTPRQIAAQPQVLDFERLPPFPERTGAGFVEFQGRHWMIGGRHGAVNLHDVWSSADAIDWALETDEAPWQQLFYPSTVVLNDRLLVFDTWELTPLWISDDGITWEAGEVPWSAGLPYVTLFNGKVWAFLLDVQYGLVRAWSTSDGEAWTQEFTNGDDVANYSVSAYGYKCIASYDGKLWITSGTRVWSTSNGTNWSLVTASAPNGIMMRQEFDNKLWIFRQNSSEAIYSSTNGSTWTLVTSSPQYNRVSDTMPYVANAKIHMIGGVILPSGYPGIITNQVWTSADGASWVDESTPKRFTASFGGTALSFQDKLWVLGGESTIESYSDEVWSSDNGLEWTYMSQSSTYDMFLFPQDACVFQDSIWLFHPSGRIMTSTDGINWLTRHEYITDIIGNYQFVVFKDKLVAVPTTFFNRKLVTSTDGDTWTENAAEVPWSARNYPAIVVHDEKLFIIGGVEVVELGEYEYEFTYVADVWYTEDGTNWQQAAANAGFAPRQEMLLFSAAGKIWMMLGNDGHSFYQDAWYSEDGSTWTLSTTDSGLPQRIWPGEAVVQDNNLYIIGGYEDGAGTNAIYVASLGQPPVFNSLALVDADGMNNPIPGYTNNAVVTVEANGELTGATIDLSQDENFTVFESLPADGDLSYNLGTGNGMKTVYARLWNTSGTSNITSATIVLDTTLPLSAVTASDGAMKIGGNINANYTVDDANPIISTELLVKFNDGPWASAGQLSGGVIAYSPATSGDYRFAVRATDAAGNNETDIPAAGDWRTVYNMAPNTAMSLPVTQAGVVYTFPMEIDSPRIAFVSIQFDTLITTGTLTVVRHDDILPTPAHFDAAKLINERLAISCDFLFGEAEVVWSYLNDNGLSPAQINRAYRLVSGGETGSFTAQLSSGEILIQHVTGFSEWYAGDASASEDTWMMLEE